jgi:hypothetical protein
MILVNRYNESFELPVKPSKRYQDVLPYFNQSQITTSKYNKILYFIKYLYKNTFFLSIDI